MIGHAVADYALQSDFLAVSKNRPTAGSDRADQEEHWLWIHALTAHCLIHAGAVWLVTGSASLGLAEFLLHWVIDYFKGRKKLSFNVDQFLHYGCKLVYAAIVVT